LVVLLPTLLAGLYLFFVAAPQYYSETRFTVRSQAAGPASLLGGALSAAGFKAASEEAAGVRDYLLSHDAVRALRERIDLVGVFRRPEADPLLRLWAAEPTAEKLLDFYRAQVSATINPGSGITELRVRSFRPEDSLEISRHLLGLGEEMVNRMNTRLQEESLRAARAEVARAQAQAAEAQTAVTAFRQREQAVDPQRSATIAVETIGRLEGEAARARAELQQLSTFARPGNPQVQNIRNRVDGLETQIAEERRRLSAAGTGVTEQIATFERLRLEADFATRSLAVGMTTLERAQAEALRQQVFLVRIVEPNLAERSLYPKPLVTTAYVFAGLALLYGLGWLLLAGVREHAA
jgi:capsular polysaccharide transport system permease protein